MPDAFLDLTPAEFHYALQDRGNNLQARYKFLIDSSTALVRLVCDVIRGAAFVFHPSKRIRKPEQLMKFSWDAEMKQKKVQTPQQIKHTLKAMQALYKLRKENEVKVESKLNKPKK